MEAGQGKHRGLRIVSCICFLLLVVALLLIDRHSPATGYELSIYESLPATMWICLFAALAGGTGIIVHQAFAGRKSKYWLLGFLVLIFAISIILLLPVLRAYYLYGSGDTLAVVQWTRGVLREGHFWKQNRYPITHILMAQLAHVSGAPPEVIVKFIPVFFTSLFILFSYLLASTVMPHKGQALLAAAATALFFNYYHVSAYPQTLSIMALPLVFYLYFKGFEKGSLPFRIAFVIVLLLFPYFHPAPAAALIACLLAAEAAKALWRQRNGASAAIARRSVDRTTVEPALSGTVTILTWISAYEIFGTTILRTLAWLGREIESVPHVEKLEQVLQQRGVGVQQQIEVALKMYGDNLIYVSLSSIALLLIALRFWHRRDDTKRLFTLSMPFLVSGPVWVLIFATTLRVTVGRLLGSNIMMWATPVFAAFALYEIFGRWKRAGIIAVTSILLCASIVGILAVYQSPYILQPSWHITNADVQGSQWFSDHHDAQTRTAVLGEVTAHGMMGLRMPEHFAYPQVQMLGDLMRRDFYVLMNARFRVAPAHPSLARSMISDPLLARSGFDEADFARLERDTTVDEVYSNGGLDVMWIKAAR